MLPTKCLCNGRVQCPHYFRFLYLNCVVGQVATGRACRAIALNKPSYSGHCTSTNVVCNWCSWNDKKCFYKRGFYISAQFSKSKTVEKSVWFRFKSLRWDRGKFALSNGWPRSKDLGTKLAVIEDIIQMATDYKRLITAFTTYLDDYWAVKSLSTVQTTDI